MRAAAYAPAPGTLAFRALAHLATLPAGTELMTSALAEAINAPPVNVIPCLDVALKHGLVFRRQRDNHVRSPFWWGLTDRSKEPKADLRKPALPVETDAQPARHPTSLLQLPSAAAPADPYGVPCGFIPRVEPAAATVDSRSGGVESRHATPEHCDSEQAGPLGSSRPRHHAPEQSGEGTRPRPAGVAPGPLHPSEPLIGRTATVSMSGEVAIVAECGAVVLFDADRARQLLEFCARVCE